MKEDLYDDLYLEEKEEKTDFKAVLLNIPFIGLGSWHAFCYAWQEPGFICVTPRRYTTSRRPSSSKTMTKTAKQAAAWPTWKTWDFILPSTILTMR